MKFIERIEVAFSAVRLTFRIETNLGMRFNRRDSGRSIAHSYTVWVERTVNGID